MIKCVWHSLYPNSILYLFDLILDLEIQTRPLYVTHDVDTLYGDISDITFHSLSYDIPSLVVDVVVGEDDVTDFLSVPTRAAVAVPPWLHAPIPTTVAVVLLFRYVNVCAYPLIDFQRHDIALIDECRHHRSFVVTIHIECHQTK